MNELVSDSKTAGVSAQSLAGKVLTFALATESYGIAVLKVREIIKPVAITPMPQMPGHVKGVVNLRGRIIPVIDLRARLGLPPMENGDRRCIIVAHVTNTSGATIAMGILVDTVEEVLNIAPAEIEPTPDFGVAATASTPRGIAKVKGRVISLLDIDAIVASDH